jgi:Tfp pilus assembly protein PilW
MNDQRGITIVEILVTGLVAGIMFLGLGSAYLATTRIFDGSTSQVGVQRQGTLALEQIGWRIRSALGPAALTTGACRGHAESVSVTYPDPNTGATLTTCYYAGIQGELWQASPPAGPECTRADPGCWDLLNVTREQSPSPAVLVSLKTRASATDPACPAGIASGSPCFLGTVPDPTRARFTFAVTDGLNVVPFDITLTCSGRNC